jgi:hypothetical protein
MIGASARRGVKLLLLLLAKTGHAWVIDVMHDEQYHS